MKFSKRAKATLATAAIIAAISGSMLAGGDEEDVSVAIQPQPIQVVKAETGSVFRTKHGLHEVAKEKEESKIEVASVNIDVEEEKEAKEKAKEVKLSNEEVANLVLLGKYGNGGERRGKIEGEGYNYEEIQKIVESKSPKPEKVVKPSVTNSVPSPQASTSAPAKTNGNVIKAFPHNTFKSYMRWSILSKSSPQGKLAAKASVDPSTAIMKYQGRYLVALGFAYAGNIGEHIDIVMESGQVIPAIVGDWKAKEHTDANNSASLNNGSIVEFIVSSNDAANRAVNGSGNYNTIFPGKVSHFIK